MSDTFEKNLKVAYLLDFYGEVLDAHTQSIMNAYYSDDLSLSEIADGVGISRQGVRHVIKKGEEQLIFLEEKLGLAANYSAMATAADELLQLKKRLIPLGEAYEKDVALITRAVSLMLRQE